MISLFSCHLGKLSYANLPRTSLHFELCLQIVERDSQCGLIIKLRRGPQSFLDYAQRKIQTYLLINAVTRNGTNQTLLTGHYEVDIRHWKAIF